MINILLFTILISLILGIIFRKEHTKKILPLLILINVSSLGLYTLLGSPQVPQFPGKPSSKTSKDLLKKLQAQTTHQTLSVDKLELLAKSLATLKHYQESHEIYKKLLLLPEKKASHALGAGETLVLLRGGVVVKEALDYFRIATSDKSLYSKASYLFFAGLYELQHGNIEGAKKNWLFIMQKKLDATPEIAHFRTEIKHYLKHMD